MQSGVVFSRTSPLTVTLLPLKQNARGTRMCKEAQLIVQSAVLVIVTVYKTREQRRVQQSLQVTTTVGPQVVVHVGTQQVLRLK